MRLINVHTLELEEFLSEHEVQYAILSHRWEDGEVLYEHMPPQGRLQHLVSSRHGWIKITECCKQTHCDGLGYVCVDTCCINKDSSAELQEAINSMFRWYANAQVCYAYLSDVTYNLGTGNFMESQWFTRGWTLQELLAPDIVKFFDSDWTWLGTRDGLKEYISRTTGIAQRRLSAAFANLDESSFLDKLCITEIMSWAAGRKTSRPEDRAYSLFGLFDVNMPMLYGEGDRAFIRLQEQILSTSNDQSLFAWRGVTPEYTSLLAESPDQFQGLPFLQDKKKSWLTRGPPSTITNKGVTAVFRAKAISPSDYRIVLNIVFNEEWEAPNTHRVAIYLRRTNTGDQYVRIRWRDDDLEMFHGNKTIDEFEHERRATVARSSFPQFQSVSQYEISIPHVTWAKVENWTSIQGTGIECALEGIKAIASLTGTCLSSIEPGLLALFDCKENGAQRPFWKFLLAFDYEFAPTCILFIDREDEEDFDFLDNPLMVERDDSDKRWISPKLRVVKQKGGKMNLFGAGILAYKLRLEEQSNYCTSECSLEIYTKGEQPRSAKLCWSRGDCEHMEDEEIACWKLIIEAGDLNAHTSAVR